MKRRCEFLDNLPSFNYNQGQVEFKSSSAGTDTKKLGSTLMEAMLTEVKEFCDPKLRYSWFKNPHKQV